MGHSIPVIYLTCEAHESPTERVSWHDAREIVETAFRDREKYHLHKATGRNWWQLQVISEIRSRDGLDGLEFVDNELTVIDPELLPTTTKSLQRVIAVRRALGQIGSQPYMPSERDIDCDLEGGFQQFLSSLLFVFETAMASGRSVVFVQPQP